MIKIYENPKEKKNLFVCRSLANNGYDCYNLLCKPCGERVGGCRDHGTGAMGQDAAGAGGWPGHAEKDKEATRQEKYSKVNK